MYYTSFIRTYKKENAVETKTAKVHFSLDPRLCKSCGICVAVCPLKVLRIEEAGQALAFATPDKCIACGQCEIHCPDFAIRVSKIEGAKV
jgi:2-oxoglutarate ferredoxin oxidoreductase subunit delta